MDRLALARGLFVSGSMLVGSALLGCGGPRQADAPAGCPRSECGSNSPTLSPRGLHELNLDGVASAGGYTYRGTVDATGASWQLAVRDGVVSAARAGQTRHDLTGLTMLVDGPGGGARIDFAAPPQAMAYWTGASAPAQGYALRWNGDAAACGTAVIFEGQRLDGEARTVSDASDRWINLGCAGTAVAKLHLSGHSQASQHATGVTRSSADGQAFLKMMSGDYCGTGQAFTVAGAPISYRTGDGALATQGGLGASEARWSAAGAVCLDTPRVVDRATVAASCSIPACSEVGVDVLAGAHLTSGR
ncbi:MAG: hypothetical protein KA190_26245 [Kofleriaceae bacterium]|nr:hypothetical protein [Kofleriaceae bacterium]